MSKWLKLIGIRAALAVLLFAVTFFAWIRLQESYFFVILIFSMIGLYFLFALLFGPPSIGSGVYIYFIALLFIEFIYFFILSHFIILFIKNIKKHSINNRKKMYSFIILVICLLVIVTFLLYAFYPLCNFKSIGSGGLAEDGCNTCRCGLLGEACTQMDCEPIALRQMEIKEPLKTGK